MVDFTCTVSYKGRIYVTGRRDAIKPLVQNIVEDMKPQELQQSALFGVQKKTKIGRVTKSDS